MYVAIRMLLLPLVVSSCFRSFVVSFFFLFAGAHRNGCLQKEGPEAQVQSGPELEGVRLRRRAGFTSTTQRLVVT